MILTLSNITWLDACLAGVTAYLVKQVLTKKNPAPYPPGPPVWPLIGNVPDMPSVRPWLTFADWGEKYGDISHVEVLGQHIVVLNSIDITMEMLDKKSSKYSDRPIFPMGGELVGLKNTLSLMPYGDSFRWNRKNFHSVIGNRAAMKDYDVDLIEEIETRRFLKRVLDKPEELKGHIRHTAGAVILRISHGYEVKENNDPFVELADRALDIFSKSTAPGAWMVDIIPSLSKVPEWFPGAGFKRIAREWNGIVEEMISAPFQFVKVQMAAGIAPKSLASSLLANSLSAEEEHMSKWSTATLYGGGADTTVSSIYSFFLAMVLYPDVQRKAQAEIDAIIGIDRLPSLSDLDSLPYTGALVKEVHRWNAVIPTGVPHRVTEDDIHGGYYIPKGSLIIPNIWFMLNDSRTYSNPSEFNPERFLPHNEHQPELDPRMICFGFGRRICPGIHLADASVWISIVMSLAAFNISKVVENGVEITPEIDPSSGTISHPKPFKCSVKPRSAKALALIQQDISY